MNWIISIATFRSSDCGSCSSIVSIFIFCPVIVVHLILTLLQNSLASFLPPSTTIRKYHRKLLSTTSALLGTVYCAILSFACTKEEPEIQEIISSLLALRAKLIRSVMIRTNIDYEVRVRKTIMLFIPIAEFKEI